MGELNYTLLWEYPSAFLGVYSGYWPTDILR